MKKILGICLISISIFTGIAAASSVTNVEAVCKTHSVLIVKNSRVATGIGPITEGQYCEKDEKFKP